MINLSPTLVAVIIGVLITAFVLSPIGRRVEKNRRMFKAILVVLICLIVGNAVALMYFLVNQQATALVDPPGFTSAEVLSSATGLPLARTAATATTKSTIVSTRTQQPLPATATVIRVTPTGVVNPTPSTPQTATPNAAPAPTSSNPGGPVAVALPWPAHLPSGMEFAAEDSWPLRVIDAQHIDEPFLVFRDGTRWVVVRYVEGNAPMEGATQPFDVAGKQGALQTNADGSFRAAWQQDGRTLEMSGIGLSTTEIVDVANGFREMSATQLQARLIREAAHRQLNITLLWPDYLPPGVNLATNESVVELSQPGTVPNADRYHLVFRGEQAVVQIGGGTDTVPVVPGETDRFEADGLTGQLIIGDRRFLLVLDTGNAETASLQFAPLHDNQGRQLPLVQQGRVYISAENLDRAQFERIVAGLVALRAPEFQARARGEELETQPSNLP